MPRIDILNEMRIRGCCYQALCVTHNSTGHVAYLIHKTDFACGRHDGPRNYIRDFKLKEDMLREFPCAQETDGWKETDLRLGHGVTTQDYALARTKYNSNLGKR